MNTRQHHHDRMSRPERLARPGVRAFTLMEVLLALAVSAIVMAGIGGVFFSALRLRERTTALLDEAVPLHQAFTSLRRDLRGALPPGGVFFGQFRIGPLSTALAQTGNQSFGLQFTTTTALINDEQPWGDVQEVTYELREPAVRTGGSGRELVRTVSRNLLAATVLDYQEQFLMGRVETFEVAGFDGFNWRELWDTSLTETNLPKAVRVRIHMVAEPDVDIRGREPIELMVPLTIQTQTNQTQEASEEAP